MVPIWFTPEKIEIVNNLMTITDASGNCQAAYVIPPIGSEIFVLPVLFSDAAKELYMQNKILVDIITHFQSEYDG